MNANQPPALDSDCKVPPSSLLIRSAASRFVDQQTNNIYLSHYWSTIGPIDRIAFICICWELVAAFVESAVAPVTGQPAQFSFNPGGTSIINVFNVSQDPEVLGPLPFIIHLPTEVWSNEAFITGHALPWHNWLELTPQHVPHFHYHVHERRRTYDISPEIKHNGKYRWEGRMTMGTHVQNFQRMTQ